jgi:thioredoxin 1
MTQPTTQASFSPPWFLIVGILAGMALIAFIVWDSPGSARKKGGSAHVVELTQANWQIEVVESDVPVVVDFWAPWCGPCRDFAPTIDKLATDYAGKVKVGKLNVDDAPKIAERYGAPPIPRILVFKGGSDEPAASFLGGQTTQAQLARAVDSVLARR